jgi:hypothetical protein
MLYQFPCHGAKAANYATFTVHSASKRAGNVTAMTKIVSLLDAHRALPFRRFLPHNKNLGRAGAVQKNFN